MLSFKKCLKHVFYYKLIFVYNLTKELGENICYNCNLIWVRKKIATNDASGTEKELYSSIYRISLR